MATLPVRGPGVRALGLPLPPARMPLLRDGRPLKRWRYVGVYGPELMLCVGEARVGGVPQRWWAVALPDGTLWERTTGGRGGVPLEPGSCAWRARRDDRPDAREPEAPVQPRSTSLLGRGRRRVEVASPHGGSYIWTRKQGGVRARGSRAGRRARVARSTGARSSTTAPATTPATPLALVAPGSAAARAASAVAWNLVDGVHDAPTRERAHRVGRRRAARGRRRSTFAADLSSVGDLRFTEWSARNDDTNRLLVRSRYRQPFGTFSGALPGGGPGWPRATASWSGTTSLVAGSSFSAEVGSAP